MPGVHLRGCRGIPGAHGVYQPHLAFRTLVIGSDVVQSHVALVGPGARNVTTHATDHGNATQPALIRRRTTGVDAR